MEVNSNMEGVVKIRIEAVGGDLDRVACRYPASFMNEMARQLTEAIEAATGVTGIADSSVELVMVFAPSTYMEHISGNVTYRRIMLVDAVSAPRDFWVKWTRLEAIEGEYTAENILFELGEDVEQTILQREYKYLLSSGKEKYHNSMSRRKVTEWREVIKRAARRGELSKVESDYELAPETLELEARIADLLGKRIAAREEPEKAEVPYITEDQPVSDEYARALEKARMVVESAVEDEAEELTLSEITEQISDDESADEPLVLDGDSDSDEAIIEFDEEDESDSEAEELDFDEESEDTEEEEEEIPADDESDGESDIFTDAESEDEGEDIFADGDEYDPESDEKSEDEQVAEESEEKFAEEFVIEDDGEEAVEESEDEFMIEDDSDEELIIEEDPEEEDDSVEDDSDEEFVLEESAEEEDEESIEVEDEPIEDEDEAVEEEEELDETEKIEEAPVTAPVVESAPMVESTPVVESVSAREPAPVVSEPGIAERVADIRAQLETKIRLEYEVRAREKAERELVELRHKLQTTVTESEVAIAELKAENERLRREYDRLVEQIESERFTREAEEARRRLEERQLREQIEKQLRAEAAERERLAESARMAIEEQHRLEAENARIAREREEEARVEAERARQEEHERELAAIREAELARIRREQEEAQEKAKAAMPEVGDGKYSYTTKIVKLIFHRNVDPNITSRIQVTIKNTVDYYGKDDVYLRIRASIPDSHTVLLEFIDIPLEEMPLLGNIIKVLGNSGLGIAKAIVE